MAEFLTACYKKEIHSEECDEQITISIYEDTLHFEKIFCPDCGKAPIHIVRPQKGAAYFRSNRKEEHKLSCQHYSEFVQQEVLNKLLSSAATTLDRQRLDFIIKSNFEAIDRINKRSDSDRVTSTNVKEPGSERHKKGSSILSVKNTESLVRISFSKLKEKYKEHLNALCIIHGQAEIEIRESAKNGTASKQLLFRESGVLIFAIFIEGLILEYFNGKSTYVDLKKNICGELNGVIGGVRFMVFGELYKVVKGNAEYINMKIRNTKHLQLLPLLNVTL